MMKLLGTSGAPVGVLVRPVRKTCTSWESLGCKMLEAAVLIKCEVGRTGPAKTAHDSGK